MIRFLFIPAFLLMSCADSPETNSSVKSTNNATNGSTNNSTNISTNNSTSNTNSATNGPEIRVDTVESRCENYCEIQFGDCVTAVCTLPEEVASRTAAELAECLEPGPNGCVERYATDAELKALVDDHWSIENCLSRTESQARCYRFGFEVCGCVLPKVGQACTSDADCAGGLLTNFCVREAENGIPLGGMCVTNDCNAGPNSQYGDVVVNDYTGCGSKNPCVVYERANQCGLACSGDTCRDGYFCVEAAPGEPGICRF